MITILGPTASGKTSMAARLAVRLGNAEIISADSRQLYRGMDVGTGKDLADYVVDGQAVPYHLIDVCEAGERYNLFRYQQDFWQAYHDVTSRGRRPILCGGTGLYIESILKSYKMVPVPENPDLREQLRGKTLAELAEMLAGYKPLHNTTDIDTPQRAIRAIEIQEYYRSHHIDEREFPRVESLTVGLMLDREERVYLRTHGKLSVLVVANERPYAYLDENGELAGASIRIRSMSCSPSLPSRSSPSRSS